MKKTFIKFGGVLLIGFVFSPAISFAVEFPIDAKTVQVRNESGSDLLNQLVLATSTLPDTTRTFLGVYVASKDSRENTVYCGTSSATSSDLVVDTMGSLNATQRLMMYKCNKAIYADIMRTSFIGITYVDRNIASSTLPNDIVGIGYNVTVLGASSSPAILYYDMLFPAGLIVFFLAFIAFGSFFTWGFKRKRF